jgi:hypothetical protein
MGASKLVVRAREEPLKNCDREYLAPRLPIGLCFAVFIAAQAMSFGAVPAAAEPGGLSTEQGGAGQSQSDSEQESAGYNGGDITRPQNQLDIRFQYRTSWQPDTRTRQERMLLRVTSKLTLDAGWKAGLFAEVPCRQTNDTV